MRLASRYLVPPLAPRPWRVVATRILLQSATTPPRLYIYIYTYIYIFIYLNQKHVYHHVHGVFKSISTHNLCFILYAIFIEDGLRGQTPPDHPWCFATALAVGRCAWSLRTNISGILGDLARTWQEPVRKLFLQNV